MNFYELYLRMRTKMAICERHTEANLARVRLECIYVLPLESVLASLDVYTLWVVQIEVWDSHSGGAGIV